MQNFKKKISYVIFMGRWLQLPLYCGLFIALGVYVYRFLIELGHLILNIHGLDDTYLMLGILDLIDVVLLANLLIMVIMGGYDIFVSHLLLETHPEKPEWLSHLDAGGLKVKLALALVGISSIHLLRTFFETTKLTNEAILWQVVLHLTLLFSALLIAVTNKLLVPSVPPMVDETDN